ncbi:MAG: universal stress protein [Succinivibrionaceae bacterium]|nr:universal stress protein [Succinivibrionaceae bacterium]
MRELKKILVVMEPRRLRQPALERALALCRMAPRHDIEVCAVLPVHDFSWDVASVLSVEQGSALPEDVMGRYQRWLEAYLSVNAMGVRTEARVLWSRVAGKEITALARDVGADLIIKGCDSHGLLDQVLFTPLDWQLLRHAPAPVLVAREELPEPGGMVAVALDLSDPANDAQRLLNERLLREARGLARMMRSQIHVISAIVPMLPQAPIDLPGLPPEVLGDGGVEEGCRLALEFARHNHIPQERCHVRVGAPEEVITGLAGELSPKILFIGTAARSGLPVAILGNVCERIIDTLSCDVVVVNPKAVVRQLPTPLPSKAAL